MIKRPLNPQFNEKVRSDEKFTTIREKPWTVGKLIMLYNWSGKAYASPQTNVAVIQVSRTIPIVISNTPDGMRYSVHSMRGKILWQTEGFDSGDQMDAWFSAVVRPGQSAMKWLMVFKFQPELSP